MTLAQNISDWRSAISKGPII